MIFGLYAGLAFCLAGHGADFPDFRPHTIDQFGNRMGQTSLVDLDRDGDLDWVTGQAKHAGAGIWWWEYRGPDEWVRHKAGEGNTDVGGSTFDVNGDGWPDLFSGSRLLISNGNAADLQFRETDVGAIYSHDSEFADINGDARMDALANSDQTGLFWYEIPDDPAGKWKEHRIASSEDHKIHGGVSPRAAGDMDGDGDTDVVTGEAWYENLDGKGLSWKAHHNIEFGAHHRYGLAVKTWVLDMDGDGDQDFVQAEADHPDGRVAWFENDGSGNWTLHIIKDKGEGQDFHSLVVADFDGDGDQDVFSGGGPLSSGKTMRCYIWENLAGPGEKPVQEKWREHVIMEKPCHEAVGGDVDGDGDIDLCFKPWSTGNEHVFLENLLKP
jgi:hypothetical protein